MRPITMMICLLLAVSGSAIGQLSNGLIHHWPLDGSNAGLWVDTVGGCPLSEIGTVGSTAGKMGNCARFSSGWLSCQSVPDMEANGASFTIAFWFRIGLGAPTGTIVAKSTAQYQSWQAEVLDDLDYSGTYLPDWQFGFTDALVGRKGVISGGWHLWVGSFDSSSGKIIVKIDNRSSASSAIQLLMDDPQTPFNVGVHDPGGWNQYVGDVDDVLYWSRLLTGTEQSRLWNKGAGTVIVP